MTTRPDIVIFSTADWFTRYWTNKQHAAATLAAAGHRVIYVETPGIRRPNLGSGRDVGRLIKRLWRGIRDAVAGPRKVRDNLWLLSPLPVPWRRDLDAVRRLNGWLQHAVLGRALKRLGFRRPEIWSYHPFVLELLRGLDVGPLSYHCVDDIAAVPGVDAVAFEAAETAIFGAAAAVFVTARDLEQRARLHSTNVHFFPNVVDPAHFGRALMAGAEPVDLAAIPRPRLGYHGVLSDYKVDIELLRGIAERRPGWQIVLVGAERDSESAGAFAVLRELGNVHFLGGKDYRDLPDYLRGFDIGLLPMRRNRYTQSMYPMKYFEYLAAGLRVASTGLPFARDAGGFIDIADDAEGFIAAIEAQLARGRLGAEEARAAVGDNTWQWRHEKMLAITSHLGSYEAVRE